MISGTSDIVGEGDLLERRGGGGHQEVYKNNLKLWGNILYLIICQGLLCDALNKVATSRVRGIVRENGGITPNQNDHQTHNYKQFVAKS